MDPLERIHELTHKIDLDQKKREAENKKQEKRKKAYEKHSEELKGIADRLKKGDWSTGDILTDNILASGSIVWLTAEKIEEHKKELEAKIAEFKPGEIYIFYSRGYGCTQIAIADDPPIEITTKKISLSHTQGISVKLDKGYHFELSAGSIPELDENISGFLMDYNSTIYANGWDKIDSCFSNNPIILCQIHDYFNREISPELEQAAKQAQDKIAKTVVVGLDKLVREERTLSSAMEKLKEMRESKENPNSDMYQVSPQPPPDDFAEDRNLLQSLKTIQDLEHASSKLGSMLEEAVELGVHENTTPIRIEQARGKTLEYVPSIYVGALMQFHEIALQKS